MARILVVDNDEDFCLTSAEELELEGHEVLTASTGFDAIRLVEEHAPDMVITEIRLPGMDGLELMGRLLTIRPGIIVILNSCSSRYKESFLSWSADAYIVKSDDTQELLEKVRQLLSSRSPLRTCEEPLLGFKGGEDHCRANDRASRTADAGASTRPAVHAAEKLGAPKLSNSVRGAI